MFKKISKFFRRKDSSFEEVIRAISENSYSPKAWSKRSYRGYAHEAYEKNVVAYSCIAAISKAVAGIPIIIKIKDKEITSGPVFDLLKRPNPTQPYKTFMRMAIMYRLISGNTYILGNKVYTGRIMEMTLLRPDRIQIMTSNYSEPYEYRYDIAGKSYSYPIEPITLESEILHIKEPNPLCDLYGMSPMTSAMMSTDQHNSSVEWNKNLLENSARPPGIFTLKDRNDGAPSPDQAKLDDIRDRVNEKYSGYKNAGKIPVIGFDMAWQNMGMSPTDMDWINGKNSSARDICLALGFPPFLLGLPEGATYNNVSEAKLGFYEDTVIPLAESMYDDISHYLSTHQKMQIQICPDLDKVSALTPRREVVRNNARLDVAGGIITTNEAREEGGYDPVDGGDEILVPAGKLPLNFDVADMTPKKFNRWLLSEGFSKETSQELVKMAYTNKINS